MLYQMIRERQLKNERIAIILPQNRQVFGFASGLSQVGIEVEVPDQRRRSNPFPSHDFTSPLPKVMSYYGVKGLTFDSVFMPRLVSGSFQNTPADRIGRLLFVAITRATNWCYFSTGLDAPLPLLVDKLVPLSETGQIKLLQRVDVAGVGEEIRDQDGGEEETLDFL